MSQGLFVAAGGIKACQNKLDVISDNISNINTVGFKSSQVTFENVFSRTLSSGSSATTSIGGSNPMQIGLGVTISAITRNFNSGTVQSTGKDSDLYISGTGFFTVQNTDGSTYLTRAGNFTLSSDGSLTTASGLRIFGTDKVSGAESSTTVSIPQSLSIQKTLISTSGSNTATNIINSAGTKITTGTFSIGLSGNPADTDSIVDAGNSTTGITEGTFTITGVNGSTTPVSVNILDTDTIDQVMTKIESALETATGSTTAEAAYNTTTHEFSINTGVATDTLTFGGTSNFSTVADFSGSNGSYESDEITMAPQIITITSGETLEDVLSDIEAKTGGTTSIGTNGKISITSPAGHTLSFGGLDSDSSNFLSVTNISSGLSGALRDASQAIVSTADDTSNTTSLSSWSIGTSGEVVATYDNGDRLTVITDPNDSNTRILQLTSAGIDIAEPTVLNSAVRAAQLQLQMANVVNPNGLLSEGGNMYKAAPNSGTVTYSIASTGSVGLVQSGGLESSNVDLTTEFADMMLAQRGIDANSRAFSAQNQVLSTIVNLGRS